MTYQIGQKFTKEKGYPPEAAIWCNDNNAYIEELKDGSFEIKTIPEPTLKELQRIKLQENEQKYLQWRNDDATLISSLGFTADADERANGDIEGLIKIMTYSKTQTIQFRDADNKYHDLNAEQIQTLQLEVLLNATYMYKQKWKYEEDIKNAKSKEVLDSINIVYKPKDFTDPLALPSI